jgi:hypothetical protein
MNTDDKGLMVLNLITLAACLQAAPPSLEMFWQ